MTTDFGGSDAPDIPSEADLDATDRFLSAVATQTAPTDGVGGEPLTELLRTASGPAGPGELDGAEQFIAAVSSAQARPQRAAASPATFVGRAVAAKAAVIAAVTVLGIAGAGAATGVILHVANDPRPQPVVTVDDPSATSPGPSGDVDLGGPTRGAGVPGAGVDAVRVRTCAEATDRAGLEELARAADVASSNAADYCRGTGTLADPDRPAANSRADSPSSGDESATDRRSGGDPDAPSATPGPPAGNGGANNGGGNNGGTNNGGGNNGGTNNGVGTPQTPNANANPKSGNGAANGGGNSADAGGSAAGAQGVGLATGATDRPQGRGTAPETSTRSFGPHRSPTVSGPVTPPDPATPPGHSR